MAYNIAYKQSVQRDLKRISKSEASRILNKIEKELPDKADSCSTLKGKFEGLRKYRIGDYRVVFVIVKNDVLVLRIGHRHNVYKKEIRR